MINEGVFSDLNSKEKNNHAHHFHLGLTSRCLTGIYWFFRWNIYIDKYMYINGQKWKRVSQKRIRKQSKWIKTILNAADKEKFLLSKNYTFRINWWGWSLRNKPFHTLNFRSSNIINILLILNWVGGPALWTTPARWSVDHNCPVAYGPHLPCGPRTRACHGFLFTKLPRLTLGLRSWMKYSPISGNPQHAIYQVLIGTERVKCRAGITQHKYTQLEFIN